MYTFTYLLNQKLTYLFSKSKITTIFRSENCVCDVVMVVTIFANPLKKYYIHKISVKPCSIKKFRCNSSVSCLFVKFRITTIFWIKHVLTKFSWIHHFLCGFVKIVTTITTSQNKFLLRKNRCNLWYPIVSFFDNVFLQLSLWFITQCYG